MTVLTRLGLAAKVLPILLVVGCTRKADPRVFDLPVTWSGSADLKLESSASHELNGRRYEEARLRQGENEFLIRVFRDADAELFKKMSEQKIFAVQSLYIEEKSPYPGDLSQRVDCPPDFRPRITRTPDTDPLARARIEAVANSRRNLGVCLPTEARFRQTWLLLRCPGRVLVEIQALTPYRPPEEQPEWLKDVTCREPSPPK